MYVLGFNGPPRSGKDTLAQMVTQLLEDRGVNVPIKTDHLSAPLRRIAYQMVGYEYNLKGLDGGPDYETFKTMTFESYGKTGRQLMIDVSEVFLKQCYSEDILAKLLLNRNEVFHGLLLIPDMGFNVEVQTLEETVTPGCLAVAQVHRPDCDFSNDSREWVYPFNTIEAVNDEGLEELKAEAERLVDYVSHTLRWKL